MNNPKVLIATPTSYLKDYCLNDWIENVKGFSYSNYKLMIVDNSPVPDYVNKLRRKGINAIWVNPKGRTSKEFITESQNRLRDHFLRNGYDYFFSLESDIFPPFYVIEKLMSHDLDICGVPYFHGSGYKQNMLMLDIWDMPNSSKVEHYNSLSECLHRINGKVVENYSNGIGCTLIKRHVLEQVKFRYEPSQSTHSDPYFYMDLYRLGIQNYIDTSILLEHRNMNWGAVLDHR